GIPLLREGSCEAIGERGGAGADTPGRGVLAIRWPTTLRERRPNRCPARAARRGEWRPTEARCGAPSAQITAGAAHRRRELGGRAYRIAEPLRHAPLASCAQAVRPLDYERGLLAHHRHLQHRDAAVRRSPPRPDPAPYQPYDVVPMTMARDSGGTCIAP